MRKQGREHPKKSLGARIFFNICIVIPLALSLAVGALGLYLHSAFETETPMELFRLSANSVPPRFYVYRFDDRTNRVGNAEMLNTSAFGNADTAYVPYGEIPQSLIDAFVAIEDKRFYRHRGVDWYRTAAAGITYVLGFSDSFGASTITQQTVKNVTGNNEITLKRKLQEILYALDLERTLGKDEIMELYLNVISFSDGCIGIGEAAEHYFSKTPMELTVAECATIAAITNQPSYYNPIRHPENNLYRRNLILQEMQSQGYLSDSEYQAAVSEPLRLQVSSNTETEEVRSWYVDMVIEDVINDLCREYGMSRSAASLRVHSGGLRIDIAMDPEIQKMVEDYYRTTVRTPTGADGEQAQSALIVLDSQTGDILGVAGAVGEKTANRVQNYATQTLRPPGSAIKPITVYAPALEKGIINWATVYDDVPVNFGTNDAKPWPKNATGVYRGLTNVSYAVAQSTNTVAVRILQELGLRESFETAKNQFHLENMIDVRGVTDCDVAALALGQLNYGVTLRELTAAYSVFADAGVYHGWRSYYRVLDESGEVLLSSPDRSEVVMQAGNAAVMTKLLQRVVRDGTSSSITLGKLTECAGKTGTTQNDHDRWFVGYTPELICGVWCGYEYPQPLEGSNLCTGIWNSVMQALVPETGGKTVFDVPSNVVKMTYCKDSGKLMDDACLFDPRGDRSEVGWFVKGNQPMGSCDCHVLCEFDEAGGISHGYCPTREVKKVGLIRAKRHFPMQILVTDAQYVYRGDPETYAPNLKEDQAYFEESLTDFCGRSYTKQPCNRSCVLHDQWQEEEDYEDGNGQGEGEPMTLPLFPELLPPTENRGQNRFCRHKPRSPLIR